MSRTSATVVPAQSGPAQRGGSGGVYKGRAALLSTLARLLSEKNGQNHNGRRVAGNRTRVERAMVLAAGFKWLYANGYKLQSVYGFRHHHFEALLKHWRSEQLAPATLQKYISIYRVLCRWIGKDGLIRETESYFDDPIEIRRSYVAQENRAWSAKGVNVGEKLAEVRERDRRVWVQLLLQVAFGLRAQESWLLRPHLADNGLVLSVTWGTKGGRARVVPIENELQRWAIDQAKTVVDGLDVSTIPRDYSLKRWRSRYYHICKECGITRKDGITSHGLRHERAQQIFEAIAGVPAAVRSTEGYRDAEADRVRLGQLSVAEQLGHSRARIADAYIGSTLKALQENSHEDQSDESLLS